MANYHPFGSTDVSYASRYTQYILEYNTKRVNVLDPNDNYFLKYNLANSKLLSLKYNKYKASSFVVSTDISSYNNDVYVFLDTLLDTLINGSNSFRTDHDMDKMSKIIEIFNIDFLGIVEFNDSKGWHFHMLIFYRTNYETKKELLVHQSKLFSDLNAFFCNSDYFKDSGDQVFVNCELVKSVGSMIHYVKKSPYYLITNTTELAQMYVHFERTHIFPENSLPKFTHMKNHSLPTSAVIDFFMSKLELGCIDYEQAIQDDYASNFLANRNLKELFENTRVHFMAKRKFYNALCEIIDKYFKQSNFKHCICPIIEYLQYQRIDIDLFECNFVAWLQCNSKKNTMTLIGPADTGKSVFFSSLHEIFRFANRLTSDGLFTFANAPNADVIYHEEPFITNETVEVAKLVYEGNPNTTVAVKNRGAQRLNKKIPVLITANSPIYKYCSGQKIPLDARMYVYTPMNKLTNIKFCDSRINFNHNCLALNLDIKHRANKTIRGTGGESNSRIENTQENILQENELPRPNIITDFTSEINQNTELDICWPIHKLHRCHWRTFIIYVIVKYRINIYDTILWDKSNNNLKINDFWNLDHKTIFVEHLNCICKNTY